MIIDNHVTSFELSKRLKELGVDHGFNYVWLENINDGQIHVDASCVLSILSYANNYKFIAPAYLATEILEMLPYDIEIYIDSEIKIITLLREGCLENNKFEDKNIATALAKIMICLLENKLIEVPK